STLRCCQRRTGPGRLLVAGLLPATTATSTLRYGMRNRRDPPGRPPPESGRERGLRRVQPAIPARVPPRTLTPIRPAPAHHESARGDRKGRAVCPVPRPPTHR